MKLRNALKQHYTRPALGLMLAAVFAAPLANAQPHAIDAVDEADEGAAAVASTPSQKDEGWLARRYKIIQEKKRNIFAKLRPLSRELNPLNSVPAMKLKTTIDELYNKDFMEKMRNEYRYVEVLEAQAESPYRRARPHEVQRYENQRNDMARWTAKEMLNSQLKEFFRKGDRDSSGMQVLGAMRDLTGGSAAANNSPNAAEASGLANSKALSPLLDPNLSQEEKILAVHRADMPPPESDEPSPTRLKSKLNVIRGRGQLNFLNPIVNTSVDLKVGHRDDNVVVDMTKEFRKLTLNSSLRYSVDLGDLTMNVNKKIVDNIYLDLNAQRYSRTRREEEGQQNRETAQLIYSIGF